MSTKTNFSSKTVTASVVFSFDDMEAMQVAFEAQAMEFAEYMEDEKLEQIKEVAAKLGIDISAIDIDTPIKVSSNGSISKAELFGQDNDDLSRLEDVDLALPSSLVKPAGGESSLSGLTEAEEKELEELEALEAEGKA